MVRLIEVHGLRPVPVDIDPWTLAPLEEALRAAVSGRTRVVLVAHLFAARVDLDAVVAFARERQLVLVEDCAQSIEGPADRGDRRADVSLFSFALIKTATALGGALVRVREPVLATRMHATHDQWPRQARRDHAARALRCMAALLLSRPRLYGVVSRCVPIRAPSSAPSRPATTSTSCAGCGGVPVRPSWPCWPDGWPSSRPIGCTGGRQAATTSPPSWARGVLRPGAGAARTTHWLFPVLTGDPVRLMDAVRAEGFEASRGTSLIEAVAPAPPCAAWLMARIVFLPAYPEMPRSERQRLARVVREHA